MSTTIPEGFNEPVGSVGSSYGPGREGCQQKYRGGGSMNPEGALVLNEYLLGETENRCLSATEVTIPVGAMVSEGISIYISIYLAIYLSIYIDTHMHRQIDKSIDRQTDKQIDRSRYIIIYRYTDRQIGR